MYFSHPQTYTHMADSLPDYTNSCFVIHVHSDLIVVYAFHLLVNISSLLSSKGNFYQSAYEGQIFERV